MLDSHQIRMFRQQIHVTGPEDCHPWTGEVDRDGYGRVHFGKRSMRAHHLMWILEHGEIAPGSEISHTCHHPLCCNGRHLFERPVDGHVDTILTDTEVEEIRRIHIRHSLRSHGTYALAKRFNVSPGIIRQIVAGRKR